MKEGSIATALLGAVLTMFAVAAPAQSTRVFINGTPTNSWVDWNGVSTIPDAVTPNAFFALMTLGKISSWATFEAGLTMDMTFGPGNWLRCRMEATDWAYISSNPCVHLPGNNAGVPYAAPMSLLTSNYDFGPYSGSPGLPHFPILDATLFGQNQNSYIEGLGNTFTLESWQLRTRGFPLNDLWNACPAQTTPTTVFSGYLAARFTFTFT